MGSLCSKAQTVTGELEAYQKQLAEVQSGSITAATQFGSASAQLASAQQTIDSNKQQLADARSQYESSREEALSKANVDALVDKETLAGIIKAQDFSMPAGYLDSGLGRSVAVACGRQHLFHFRPALAFACRHRWRG